MGFFFLNIFFSCSESLDSLLESIYGLSSLAVMENENFAMAKSCDYHSVWSSKGLGLEMNLHYLLHDKWGLLYTFLGKS